MTVVFKDNRVKVLETLGDAVSAFLYEAGGELQTRTQRNSRVDTEETKGSYQYKVTDLIGYGEVAIGNPLENAIWEEFGTGEYALKGNGRKGGWCVPEEELSEKAKSRMKRVVGKDGKIYYYTKGKKPNQPMKRAFDALREPLKKRLGQMLKERLGG